MSLRTVLIGEGTLVLQCGDLLLGAGHSVEALLCDGPSAERWATAHGVRRPASIADLAQDIASWQVDYVFSIVNFRILKQEIVGAARFGAVNYHDGPLPRYAGINATSWAIMAGEKEHGVTWHLVADEVDAGDILLQRAVPIDDDDTSLDLNLKCYEAAVSSFPDLVSGLANRTISPRRQDLSLRSYFPLHRAPPSGGVIDWTRPAVEIARLVRALNFGAYENSLGSAKFNAGAAFHICRSAIVVAGRAAPGSVLRTNDHSFVVACGADALEIDGVARLDGRALSISDFVRDSAISIGARLPLFDADELRRTETTVAKLAPHERYWAKRLTSLAPAEHPFVATHGELSPVTKRSERLALPSMGDAAAVAANPATFGVALVAEYLARMAGEAPRYVAYASDDTRSAAAATHGLAESKVPLQIERRAGERFADLAQRTVGEIAAVVKRVSYMRDVFARRPGLAAPPLHLPIGLFVGDSTTTDLPAPVTFVIERDGSGCHLAYDERRLAEADSARILSHLRALLAGIESHPHQALSEMPLLSAAEQNAILIDWNDTQRDYPRDVPLTSLIEAHAAQTPDAPAVTYGAVTASYAELNSRANQLARELQRRGAGADVLVGLSVDRSVDMVVALLAILKAGAAYVPLDPMFPRDRVDFMIQDSGLRILITQKSLRANFQSFAGAVLEVDAPAWEAEDARNLDVPTRSRDLAYVIYTSGSTGRPKGVQVPRRALINFLWSMREWLGATATDRMLAVTTISFDIAGLEIWLPLITGGHVVVASREVTADGEQLRDLIDRHNITLLQATPITWRQLLETGWTGKPDMQAACGGEAMPLDIANGVAPLVKRLWNLYGPTETTIWSTGIEVRAGLERVAIGRPVANTQCYILDEYRRPVPVGVTGELHIAGDGLARGYLNRPELDAEKFIADPFSRAEGARMYRTGDLARFLPDGVIECLGRTDHQVKIRGLRIELGEIEGVLGTHSAVRQAVVVAREDVPGEKRLVGYVVADDGATTQAALRSHLQQSLPDYMVPTAIVTLPAIPLTANGKVDRRALPAPQSDTASAKTAIVLPRTHVEKQLSELWEEVFNVPNVDVTTSFFDLGGDSVLAVKLMSRVSRVFGKQLPLNALFESPTVAQLAKHIEDASRTEGAHTVVSIQATGSRPPVFWIPGGAALGLFRLRALVTKLGPEQPVYGLGSSVPASLAEVETVEQRSAKYIELVRRVQPRGPYCFVGFCAGGRVAFEMAQQLEAAGERVAFVGMINCTFPNYPSGRVNNLLFRAQRFRHQIREARAGGLSLVGYVRAKLEARRAAKKEAEELAAASQRIKETGLKQGVGRHQELLLSTTIEVFERYRPRRYAGALSLFVSDDPEFAGVSRRLDSRFAWDSVAAKTEVKRFIGGHGVVVDLDEAGAFANELKLALEEAVAAPNNGRRG